MLKHVVAAMVVAALSSSVSAGEWYGVGLGSQNTWAYGRAQLSSRPYQYVTEIPNVPNVGPAYSQNPGFVWGVRNASDTVTSTNGGSQTVVFDAKGGEYALQFTGNGTATTSVSAGVGHLHGSVTAQSYINAGEAIWTDRSDVTHNYVSTLQANAGGGFYTEWRDGIKIQGTRDYQLVDVRVTIKLDAELAGTGAMAHTGLNIGIESPSGSYYGPNGLPSGAEHLFIHKEIGSDGAIPEYASEMSLVFSVNTGSTLWLRQWLEGFAGALADENNNSAFGMVNASNTALFKIEVLDLNGGDPVTLSSESGTDYSQYVTAVPEPASLGVLAIGGLMMLRRRK